MTFGDLFSGIGGFRLGLERAGHECRWACEIDRYCRAVYAANFGREPEYRDIRDIKDPPYVDIIAGGFPCQPFSVAGKRKGATDKRNLWPEMLRIIETVRPVWVLGENVPGITLYYDERIRPDLEALGFEVLPLVIPASAFGAPHRRDRLFILAHAVGRRCDTGAERAGRQAGADVGGSRAGADVANSRCQHDNRRSGERRRSEKAGPRDQSRRSGKHTEHVADASGKLAQRWSHRSGQNVVGRSHWWSTEPDVGRVAHGVPHRVDRLKALGNAVVPQVVEWIGHRLTEYEEG